MIMVCGVVLSYIVGSIPTAYIIGKIIKKIDIRDYGSGNVGATNVFRTVGKTWGIIVLIVDMLKGVCAALVIAIMFKSVPLHFKYIQCLYGAAAVCGHNWTIFLKFKGGKGVATTAGVVISIFPQAVLCCVGIFIVTVYLTRFISLGSIISAGIFPLFLWLFYRREEGFAIFLVFSLLVALFIIMRHKGNIERLRQGTERKISFRSKVRSED